MVCKVCGTENIVDVKCCLQCGHEFDEPFIVNASNDNHNETDVNEKLASEGQNNPHKLLGIPPIAGQGGRGNQNNKDKVSTYLVASSIMLAITLLFSCCMGFLSIVVLGLSITSLVFSIQANTALKNQLIDEAKQCAKKAKIFFFCTLGGFWIALILNVVMGMIMLFNTVASSGMPFNDLIKPENAEKFKDLIEEYAKRGGKTI